MYGSGVQVQPGSMLHRGVGFCIFYSMLLVASNDRNLLLYCHDCTCRGQASSLRPA
jgi:hypothetical protein